MARKLHTVIDTSLGRVLGHHPPGFEPWWSKEGGRLRWSDPGSASASMPPPGRPMTILPAKAGLIGASRGVASARSRLGIRVNVVAPGLIALDTATLSAARASLYSHGAVSALAEVATVVRFLCSEDASYITGQVITVNGGGVDKATLKIRHAQR